MDPSMDMAHYRNVLNTVMTAFQKLWISLIEMNERNLHFY